MQLKWNIEWVKFGVTTTLTVAAVVLTFTQFFHTYALSIREPFLIKQTELCIAASESAARLATGIAPEPWRKARDDFAMLFWGPLYIVEDVETTETAIKDAMFNFRVKFEAQLRQKLKKGEDADVGAEMPPLPMLSDLQYEAKKISAACQRYLSSRWEVGVLGWLPSPWRGAPPSNDRAGN